MNKRMPMVVILALAVCVVVGAMIAPLVSADGEALANPTQLFMDIYDQVSPSVVAINVFGSIEGIEGTDMPYAAGGTGFVVDTDGHIVTNFHVIDGADRIEVAFLDGTQVRAKVVGTDPDSDLAVIDVEMPAEQLIPLEYADSDILEVGQTVLAIGSPFGQRWTLTSGIVSAVDRTIQGLNEFSVGSVIQTDAAINPGNSGGPLLDLAGRVVGVNAQIQSQSGSNSGVGFAIPSNLTQRVAGLLIEQGYVEYSYLGIGGGNVSLSVIEQLDLANNAQGIVVSAVAEGSPADRGGFLTAEFDEEGNILSGDIITAIDGYDLNSMNDLIAYLARNTSPGDTVNFSVMRDGAEQLDLEVRLIPRQ